MNKKIAGKKILILDDDPSFTILLKKILDATGAIVFETHDIREATRVYEEEVPHLIILDLQLANNETGFQFVEFLKLHSKTYYPAVIVASAYNSSQILSNFGRDEIDEFIVKPISSSLILQKINRILSSEKFQSSMKLTFPDTIHIKAHIPAELDQIHEMGCQISAPIKLSSGKEVTIKSELFDKLELSKVKMTAGYSEKGNKNEYRNKISFIGINEQQAMKIRRLRPLK